MKSWGTLQIKEDNTKHRSIQDIVRSVIRFSPTIRIKMIAAFIIPIAFIIFLGIASYQKAAQGICKSYENSAKQTINTTAQYIQFGVDSMEALSTQYIVDDTIQKYLRNYSKDKKDNYLNKRFISNSILAKETTDKFIADISIFSDEVTSLATLATAQDNIYDGFLETETGKKISKTTDIFWIGRDAYLDENIGVGNYNYSLRLVRKFTSLDALLVIDMDSDTIKDILDGMGFEKTGIISFVTADGKEILSGKQVGDKKELFFDKEFYQKAASSEESSAVFNVKYQGEDNLFIYSKIGDSGAMICALVPKSIIVAQADSIKQLTIVIVIFACVIAIITGLYISTGIDKAIRYIISKLKIAAGGDLSVDFTTNRKDEFKILVSEINNTFINMKDLIAQVKKMSGGVSEATADITNTSEMFLLTTEELSNAMYEIEQGIMQQAKDAEECLHQMDSLSNKIIQMSRNSDEIGKIGEDTKNRIHYGTIVTEELTGQTQSTILITTKIIKGIEKLDEKSKMIDTIVNAISEISNQTNLLSLNASIEAARAGEVGKGFAVVADEIRKLADQTKQFVSNIQNIIKAIQSDTYDLTKSAKDAENVLVLQDTAVKNTTDSYQVINECVDNLMLHLKQVIASVNNIEKTRVSTLGAVENISAVLEEIAASTNNVNQISNNQMNSIGTLNHAADNLNLNSKYLINAVQKFKV